MDFNKMASECEKNEKLHPLTDEERLLKLINEGFAEMKGTLGGMNSGYGMVADYLLDHRVMVLPEGNDGRWIPADIAEPEPDLFVLVSVSGSHKNIEFVHAAEIGCLTEGGWFIEAYPEWDSPHVEYWRPIPRTPAEEIEWRKHER